MYAISIFLYIRFLILIPSFEEDICTELAEFRKIELNGKIIDKYINSSEHSYPMIIVGNKNLHNDTLNFDSDTTNFFHFIQIDDDVQKKLNDNLIFVTRLNTVYKIKIDFGCEEK